MSPLTAARLIQYDDKCGNGSISKGEKCSKGQSGPTAKQRVKGAAAGAATGYVLGSAISALAGKPGVNKVKVSGGPALLGASGSTSGGMGGKRNPTAAAMKNMKSAKIPRIGKKGAALIAGGALAAGALTALAMRKKKKEKMATVN